MRIHPNPSIKPHLFQPDDLVKQYTPFVYMFVQAASTEGLSHSVELYSDMTDEWLSSDLST